LFLIDIWCKI